MLDLLENDINEILTDIESRKISSDLGFFSKPYRVKHHGQELIVKMYLPVKNNSRVSSIIQNHDEYVKEMRLTGIRIPDTRIVVRKLKSKNQLVIIQEAFKDCQLLRNLIQEASGEEIIQLCEKILDDMTMFWKNKNFSKDIGFHPTLRNYCLRNSELFYIDTFPPMLMAQRSLNSIIILMTPYGLLIKKLIPLGLVNMVSDEYYNFKKMFTGIIGSCCRLKPDYSHRILSFSQEYIKKCLAISEEDKQEILISLCDPPKLSGLWILIRKLIGFSGKPNIKKNVTTTMAGKN